MTDPEELEGITLALDALLTAIDAENARHAADSGLGVSAAVLASEMRHEASLTQRAAAAIIRDPVGRALRNAVKTIGQRLNEIGGTEAMLAAAERAAELDAEKPSWRMSVMDRLWDGIGDWIS